MAFGNKQPQQLIIQLGAPMTEAQMNEAFAVSDSTPWFRALVQLVDTHRQQFSETAPGWANTNNALGMARDNGAMEALSGLLIELENRRATNVG